MESEIRPPIEVETDQPLATDRTDGWINTEIYRLYTDPDVNPYDVGYYMDQVLMNKLY